LYPRTQQAICATAAADVGEVHDTGRGECGPDDSARWDARAGGRIGRGKIDRGSLPFADRKADGGRDLVRWSGCAEAARQGPVAVAAPNSDYFSGSDLGVESRDDRRRNHCRAAGDPGRRNEKRAETSSIGIDGANRLAREVGKQTAIGIQRRATAKAGDCAGAGARTETFDS